MNRLNPSSNVAAVEADLEKYAQNYAVPKEDVRLFARIDYNNYYPLETHLDSNGKFVVEDSPEAQSLDLFLGTKRQFLHERINITETTVKLELGVTFKTGWNPDNYLVFQNGMLLNSVLYRVYCPSFTSSYVVKVIYNRNLFRKGDYIDIFYIEADDRFKNIRFNHDAYIRYVKYICEAENQVIVRVPYPYTGYPKLSEMFFIFNTQTKRYLAKEEDYTVDPTGHYVTLNKNDILVTPNVDSITFVFPYCQSDFESEISKDEVGEDTGTSFTISSYEWIPPTPTTAYSLTNIIEFKPPFTRYTLTKENFLLFKNTIFVDPYKYQIVDNSHIKLLDPIDIASAEFDKYTMLIFEETSRKAMGYRSFMLDVRRIVPTTNGQKYIPLPSPPVKPLDANFLVFNGALMFDISDQFIWDKANNRLDVQDTSSIIAGRELIVIFYTNNPLYKKVKTMELVKIKFTSTEDGSVLMENTAGYDISFNNRNCIIFMNGTYLDPDRYSISNNVLTFNNPLDVLRKNKAFTGCYLVARKLSEHPVDILDDIRDGYPNKLLWFDEMKQKAEFEEVVVSDTDITT